MNLEDADKYLKNLFANKQLIRVLIFLKVASILSIIYVISFIFAFAKAEGGEGILYDIMSIPALVISFPFVYISWHLNLSGFKPLGIAAFLDILVYAMLLERLNQYFKAKR